jgi:plastocyanin
VWFLSTRRARSRPRRAQVAAGVRLSALAAIAGLLVGCGGSSSSSSSEVSTAGGSGSGAKAVTIADYTFEPAEITVPVGTTVTFTNKDSTPHTATSKRQGAFDSGSIDTGKTATITLSEAGTFAYYCQFHPFMKGTITVE